MQRKWRKKKLDKNRENHYYVKEVACLCMIDEGGVKDYMKDKYLYLWKQVFREVTGKEAYDYEVIDFFEINRIGIEWEPYLKDALNQIIKGNYSDRYNLLGTLGELGLAFNGVDVVQDVRDLSYDVLYWNEEWEENGLLHAGITGVDALSVLPVIGIIGKADEGWALCRRAKGFFVLKKLTKHDVADKIAQAGTMETKYLVNTAGAADYKVEWIVSDESAVNQLTEFFKEKNVDIIVTFYPE